MNPRYERLRWQTFGITWLIYASFYLTRSSFSVAKVALAADPRVSLTRHDWGLIDSTFLTVYMLGQFVFGPLGDRFGPRRLLIFGLGLSALAAFGSGMSTMLTGFLVFNALQGVAQATGWSNTTKAMSSWFSVNERGRVIGWWCTHYTIGAAVALPFAGWMMQHYGSPPPIQFPLPPAPFSAGVLPYIPESIWPLGPLYDTKVPFWPAAFWGPGVVVAGVMLLTALLLKNRPEDVGLPPIDKYHGDSKPLTAEDEAIVERQEGSWELIGTILATPRIWMLAISYFSVKLVRYVFIFWGPTYVAETIHSNAFASAIIAAAMPIGGLVGVITAGYISDKMFQSRRAPAAVLSLLLCALLMTAGLTHMQNPWLIAAFFLFVGVFLFGPDSMISATASMDYGTKRGAGTAVGFVNGIGSIGGILGGWLPGQLTTGSDWTPLFAVMLLGLYCSAIVLLPLWRVKPSID